MLRLCASTWAPDCPAGWETQRPRSSPCGLLEQAWDTRWASPRHKLMSQQQPQHKGVWGAVHWLAQGPNRCCQGSGAVSASSGCHDKLPQWGGRRLEAGHL